MTSAKGLRVDRSKYPFVRASSLSLRQVKGCRRHNAVLSRRGPLVGRADLTLLYILIGLVLFGGCPDYSHQAPVPDYSIMKDTGVEGAAAQNADSN
jgi:hypothetical protein